jgi:hypothetical protein
MPFSTHPDHFESSADPFKLPLRESEGVASSSRVVAWGRGESGALGASAAKDDPSLIRRIETTSSIVTPHVMPASASAEDVGIQTEPRSPDRKSIIASLLHESPQILQVAQRWQKLKTPGTMSTHSPLSAMDTTAPLDTTLEVFESPRTDADSESTSVATTVAPRELRFRGKWSEKLDVETQRIARIMRGSCGTGEESDGSSSTGSD